MDIENKEHQLQNLISQKQAELEHYELCLRREAKDLVVREEKIEKAEREMKQW